MRFTERIAELEREREPFAVATVVARLAPVSSHLGDRAIVFADGRMEGFVGGACSRDIVRRHARAALNSHKPLLLRVRPGRSGSEAASERNADVVDVPMSCTSEGAVDIFVEPHVPRPHFLIAGFTPVADVLARVAATLDYVVERFVSHEELPDVPDVEGVDVHEIGALPIFLDAFEPAARARSVAVVASQGHYDEIALAGLLKAHLAFVGLVASRKRGAGVRAVLAQEGVSEAQLATLRSPVGLDIGARTPGEKIAANGQLDSAISRLLLVVENYPNLKANENFLRLQDELAGTENRIAVERHKYNETLQRYNTNIGLFPNNLFASMLGFHRNDEYFKTEERARQAPAVSFK